MARIRHVIGIDISKKTLDLALFMDGEYSESFKIENFPEAIQEFEKHIKTLGCKVSNTIFCAEAMGVYGTFLRLFAENSKWRICFESALRIHRSLGIPKGKNDKADAKRIADFAIKNLKNLQYYKAPREIIVDLRYFDVAIQRLSKAYTILKARKKCYQDFNLTSHSDSYLKSLSAVKNDIDNLERNINELIERDDRLSRLREVICSIPGIGPKLFRTIIITTNEFKNFDSPQKYASYCTVAPFMDESGISLKKRSRTSGIGNKSIKSLLHLGVIASLRNKKSHFYRYYCRRKVEKYTGYKLMNALRNKLIHTVFSCVRNMQHYRSGWESL